MNWRDKARPIITKIIADNLGASERYLRRLFAASYPWGEKTNHPYKVWCDEINVQLGKREFGSKKKTKVKQAGQREMFKEGE